MSLKTFNWSASFKDVGPATHVGSSSNTNTATFTNTGTTNNDDINASLVVSGLASAHSLVSSAVSSMARCA